MESIRLPSSSFTLVWTPGQDQGLVQYLEVMRSRYLRSPNNELVTLQGPFEAFIPTTRPNDDKVSL